MRGMEEQVMTTISRRTVLQGMGISALATALSGLPVLAQDRTAIRIGYAVPKTGANAAGAGGGRRLGAHL